MRCLSVAVLAVPVFGACSTTANISDVYTGLDAPDANGDTRRRTVFFTDTKEIHCIAEMGVGRPDVTVETFIHQIRAFDFQANEFFETDRYLGFVEIKPERQGGSDGQPSKPVYLDFVLGRVDADGQPKDDAPFEAGSYVCEVALDGEIQKTARFNIDFPPCPSAFLVPNGPCFRFFKEGDECPQYGILSDDPAKCTCSALRGWECDG